MKSILTLIRRTAVGLSAIVALTVTGYAVSQTSQVQLFESNGSLKSSCSYSTMTVTPSGGIQVTCSGTTSSGPTFALAAPTSLPVNTTTSSNEVRVVRTGTSNADVQVNYSVSGNGCVAANNASVTFLAGTGGSMEISVTTNATAGQSCVVQITPPAGMAGAPVSRTISVVDPDANVVFAFASGNPTSAAMGGSAVNVTVTRTGGTNGDWSVPVQITGGTLGNVGDINGSPLSFPANGSGSATFQYVPPPASGSPGTVIFGFGAPNRNPAGTQTATATSTYTLSLSSPPAGCPAQESAAADLKSSGTVNTAYGTSPVTATYMLPNATTGLGEIGLYQSAFTPQNGNLRTEIWISRCKGMPANPPPDACYLSSTSLLGPVSKLWQTKLTLKQSTPALVAAAGRCYAPAADGPWFINIRITFDNCPAGYPTYGNSCGWQPIWKPKTL